MHICIHRPTDGTHILERMNNLAKNPAYLPLTVMHRGHRLGQVRQLSADCLSLHEVVGEGAFGQVFRG